MIPENFRELANFFVLQVFAMFLITLILPKIKIKSMIGAISIVLSLSLLNATIWDSQLFHKLPDFQSSHGIALILTNGALFFVLVKILPGIEIKGVLPAIIAPVAYSFATIIIQTHGTGFDAIEAGKTARDYVIRAKEFFQEARPEADSKSPPPPFESPALEESDQSPY